MNKRQAKKLAKQATQVKESKGHKDRTQRGIEQMKRYEKQLSRRGTIKGALKTGINTITYDPTQNTGGLAQHQLSTKLLEPLVKDKGLLDLLAQNQEKYKTRLSHTVVIQGIDANGDVHTVMRWDTHATYTIPQLINKINEVFKRGKSYQSSQLREKFRHNMNLVNGKYDWTAPDKFTITNITATTTFRRG